LPSFCVIMIVKKTTEQFIKDAQQIHGDKYSYEETIYVRANQKVKINCSKHGSFHQEANSHLRGHGCKECAMEERPKGTWDRKAYQKEYCREWRQRNVDYLKEYDKKNIERKRINRRASYERRKKDPAYKIERNCRSRISKAINRGDKAAKTKELLGCSIEELKDYLEDLFVEGMTWQNYGLDWHIDHILPCCSFDLLQPEQQLICFNYKNLQPLWAKDNLKKGGKFK
jgi:hypothetical protein